MSFADRIRETVTFTGTKGATATITLPGSASTGYDPFSRRYTNGTANIPVVIAHRTADEWQTCLCTYTTTNTLTVNSIVATSDAADAAVNFSAGDKDVYVSLLSSLQSFVFERGNQTAVAGGNMRIDLLRESNTVEKLQTLGGIWPLGPVHTYAGVSKEFNTEVTGSAGGPFASLFSHVVNNNNAADVCSFICTATAWTNNDTVFGANIIARNKDSSTTGTKLVGAEIDVVPASGTTSIDSNSGGLFVNMFNIAASLPAIQIGGVGGGTFGNGIVIGGVSSTGAGVAGQSATTMGSLINTGSATYNQDAIILSNNHKLRLSGTSTTHAKIYNDTSNNVRAVLGSGLWIFRDSGDATSLVSVAAAGGQGIVNVETASGEYRVNGTTVVKARQTGWGAPTGTATRTAFDTGTVSLIGLAERVKALIDNLTTHGLIGP